MSTTDTGLSDQQKLATPAAPRTNDDLTIAEQLRLWKQPSGADGVYTFRDESGRVLDIEREDFSAFIEVNGPLHPGDYRARHDRDWRDDFIALAQS
ncbi:hypothetical protein OKA04_14965 [Luteolibacter flavescens]|uniref:KTSC domain-containing protein n=1 Tax=Luteolibacter flavescens TaxID=1859460 RepID=A0ABT3FR48_9BACT|nr:hypothetical protein [Luteolibacter flavescens]MCW1886037.1 hypothetical protein [Luteolibacter flavescens]